jgi:hypothetical protein
MKTIIYLFLILLNTIVLGQNSIYKKILFDKPYKKEVNSSILKDSTIRKLNFPKYLFECEKIKNVISFYNNPKNDPSIINKKTGSILECTFFNKEDFTNAKTKINVFRNNNYSNFSAKFEYKEYHSFILTGLIIAFDNKNDKMLLINVNSCVFPDQKKRILSILKNYNQFKIYIFNCGGKELVNQY